MAHAQRRSALANVSLALIWPYRGGVIMLTLQQERARRRTFAIISHPDAGKTTLTEKLLLHSGAIHIAGSVKARKGRRHVVSDWMDIEKQRGISVASSVMQMEYRGHVLNLLDTPGHQDFSEDTYRVLTAVDAALMIIDAANGVEAQTLRLIEVCRSRQTPIITFVNKMDREVRYPLELVDELEQVLGIPIVPFSWPIGMGRNFHGVIDAARATVKTFSPGWHDKLISPEVVYDFHEVTNMSSDDAIRDARTELELVLASAPAFSEAAFHDGRQSPLFFGSAVNNFGVQEVLDALVDIAPSPKSRPALERTVEAIESEFTGVVFKIQANMDPPAPRQDRIHSRLLRPIQQGFQVSGDAYWQDDTCRRTGIVSIPAQRSYRASLPGRYCGATQPWSAPAGRHTHLRRTSTFSWASVFCSRDIQTCRHRRSDEGETAKVRPASTWARGCDPGVPGRFWCFGVAWRFWRIAV